MANLIDKDPEQILKYTQNVNQAIDIIAGKINSSITVLDGFIPDLNDKNCLALFKDLSQNCDKFIACLDKLRTENDDIDSEAKKLKLIIDEGMGGYKI